MGNHPMTMYARANKFKRKTALIKSLADSVIVITGASQGMGRELTYRYAARGCKIVIAARKMDEL